MRADDHESDKKEHKERVLTQGRSSVTRSIAGAVVLKKGDVFFLSEPDGSVPLDGRHGYGFIITTAGFSTGTSGSSAAPSPMCLHPARMLDSKRSCS